MIPIITRGQPIKYGVQSSQQPNGSVSPQNKFTLSYSKTYSNSSSSISSSTISLNNPRTISFKGQILKELPSTWFFDPEQKTIKDNFGVDYDLDPQEQKFRIQQSKENFENFRKTACQNLIPVYRFIPRGKLYKVKHFWLHDGYVSIKNPIEIEYFSWRD